MIISETDDWEEILSPIISNEVSFMKTDVGPLSDHSETRLIRLAGSLLARSQILESRIAAIESAAQTCNCAKVVSEAILDLLQQAANILEKIRQATDVDTKYILSDYYDKVLNQIDGVVTECVYDGKNLAKKENITIYTDKARGLGFSIEGIDMSSAGMGLQPLERGNISNSQILDCIIKVEHAINRLTAHSYSYLTISEMLNTHMKFARGMIDILDEGSNQIKNSRAGQSAVAQILSKVCGSIAEGDGARSSHSDRALENDKRNTASRSEAGLGSAARGRAAGDASDHDEMYRKAGLVTGDAGF